MLIKTAAAATLLTVASVAHAAPPTDLPITRSDMQGQWPLTVESGVIGCERGGAIKFVAGGKTYYLNGTAQAYSKQMGFAWHPVTPIWRDNAEIPGTKISLSALIAKGQTLCRPWP